MATSKELDMFGWEWLYKLIENNIKSSLDVVISVTHFCLIRRGFLCAGVGEDLALPKFDTLSELLPEGWNSGSTYRLRYVYDKRLYLLSTITNDNMHVVIINLSRPADGEISGVTIDLHDIHVTKKQLHEILPNYANIMKTLDRDLIDKLTYIHVSREAHTQTPATSNASKESHRFPLQTHGPLFGGPLGVGSSDLNPFADGGGMIMQPPGLPRFDQPIRGPRLPPEATPPGARFDPMRPFGNPRAPRNRHPDNDQFPPPDFDHNMFM